MGKDMSQAVSYYDMFDKDKQTEVVRGLSRLHLTIAAAESCTGGLIAARLTDVPGASAVFHCGVVSYSNEIKASVLGVNPETLRDFSAVSAETAAEMAAGVRRIAGADIAVAVTGNAGPEPSEGKPVGEVFISVLCGWHQETVRLNLKPEGRNTREQIRYMASEKAFDMILQALKMREGQ